MSAKPDRTPPSPQEVAQREVGNCLKRLAMAKMQTLSEQDQAGMAWRVRCGLVDIDPLFAAELRKARNNHQPPAGGA